MSNAIYDLGPEFAEVMQILGPMLAMMVGFFAVCALMGLANYILRGIALYRMSVERNIPNGWLGFIPYVHNYQLGRIAGEIEFGNKTVKNPGIWLLMMPVLYSVVFSIGYAATMVPYFIQVFRAGMDVSPAPEELIAAMTTMMASMFIFMLVIVVAQVFLYLFRYLTLHKIFSQYSGGQKPVFYMIICMFVPLAEAILLFMHRNKPLPEEGVIPSIDPTPTV